MNDKGKTNRVELLDTTLRDGMQGEGMSFSLEDKLKITRKLARLGVSIIEGGTPSSNPKDVEFFANLDDGLRSRVAAFGSTRRKGIRACDEPALEKLLAAGVDTACIFGKTSLFHVTRIIRTEPSENLEMIYDTVAFLREHGMRVIFDAEHFFDAYGDDPSYALAALGAAVSGGADTLCLCDTNGGSYYTQIYDGVRRVCREFDVTVGIHCHNDCGLAVANTLAAVDGGARHIQGTFLGIGERCGNASLSAIIPTLQLKRGYDCIPPENMQYLTPTARAIAELSNTFIPKATPYIGRSAFAHKGGMHIDAVRKVPSSFEHIVPESVGNARRFIISEVSGKAAILDKIQAVAPDISAGSPEVSEILAALKEQERLGYQFEAAEQSLELMILRHLSRMPHFFDLEYFRTIGEQPHGSENSAYAIIKILVDGETEVTAAEGNGPVNAIDKSLKKALIRFYPELRDVSLTDYKVRVLESSHTTAATVRVLIESTDGAKKWSTAGVSEDIINASFKALVDALEYKLLMVHRENTRLTSEG